MLNRFSLHMANTYKLTLDTLLDAVRTTVAAVVSMLLARTLKLPEYYWAPISAIVIIQSTIDPRTVSWQRFAGTALGAALGAIGRHILSRDRSRLRGRDFFVRSLCALLRLRGAYRFTAITLSIVLLIAHQRPPWIVATHRFVEVSLGIAVGLGLAECSGPVASE